MKKILVLPLVCLTMHIIAQQTISDSLMISKIREEGLNHSQVMDIAFHLTDANGPRLMQSPGYFRAADWSKKTMAAWGLENTDLEEFGFFGKGWELEKFYLAMKTPYYMPLIGFPKTFSTGTDGLQNAPVILLELTDSSGLKAYQGLVKGKILIIQKRDSVTLGFQPDAIRYSESDLAKMASFDPKVPTNSRNTSASHPTEAELLAIVKRFAVQEGALGILTTSKKNRDGTVFVQNGISYKEEMKSALNDISISLEDYLSMQRLLQHKIPVSVELDIRAKIYADRQQGVNVIAEISGTDPSLKDQLVMIGAHLDSWQGSTGATDNAAGSAVMMEAMRILKTIHYQPRRTIRLALWGGEETGLHGSENYVKNHFKDSVMQKWNAAGDKLSVYFNLDNGTGKIRGIYLQGNQAAGPIFKEWFKPFHDLGASTLTLQNTGGTDFLSFDAIGLSGFQFIQDPMEYGSRTHHSTMDSYDHLSEGDLKQAATIIAAFVYNACERQNKIPRK